MRPFDWRDIPALYKNRKQSVYLDSALYFTRGPISFSGALVSYIAPSLGLLTCIRDGVDDRKHVVIGQLIHSHESQNAKLTFLTPDELLQSNSAYALLEYMISLSGERGALRLLADVDEQSTVFETLRKLSFSIYTRQHIWAFPEKDTDELEVRDWREARSEDNHAIRSLYNNLAPGLVVQVEPFENHRLKGMVHYVRGELHSFIELRYGRRGIWANPLIHPSMENVFDKLSSFLAALPGRRSRNLYFSVRSYQSWLNMYIEQMGATEVNRQAVMYKHLASLQKVIRSLSIPSIERGQPEVSTPIIQAESKQSCP